MVFNYEPCIDEVWNLIEQAQQIPVRIKLVLERNYWTYYRCRSTGLKYDFIMTLHRTEMASLDEDLSPCLESGDVTYVDEEGPQASG